MQCSNTILMVRPVAFSYNEQTAENNSFQEKGYEDQAQENALEEFDNYVKLLTEAAVNVIIAEDTPLPHTPDSIFPNNWFTTHGAEETGNGGSTLVLYPMNAPNRRLERDKNVLRTIAEYQNKTFRQVIDLTHFEKEGKFLEGTGSLILDRKNKIAFCCTSPRTHEDVLEEWAALLDYDYFLFDATDEDGTPIYHTNVMMCVGVRYAFVCLDAITNLNDREQLIEILEENGKEIIEITFEQMHNFAGNMLVVANNNGELVLVLSATAKSALTKEQLAKIEKHYQTIVSPKLNYIEKNGGGSARCMLAEVF
ncbi:MAG: arginine deiminase-related protein [Bacteroidales bacterium]